MAPNGTYDELAGSHYGAMKMEGFETDCERKSQKGNKLVVAAAVVFFCTVGVFAMTLGSQSARAVMTVNEEGGMMSPPVAGDGSTRGPDCTCATACAMDKAMYAGFHGVDDPQHNVMVHFCGVDPKASCPPEEPECAPCIGIDDRTFNKQDAAQGCTNDDGSLVMVAGVPNCRAVCEFQFGRYDCWSYPCYNDGFCLDASDGYTCECTFGYAGPDCKMDVNECDLEDPPVWIASAMDNNVSIEKEAKKVCDINAFCENGKGNYRCECNAGWQGDGYRKGGDLWYDTPSWVHRPTEIEEPGFIAACIDIDSCRENPCHNGATCLNMEGYVGQDDYDCECALGPLGAVGWVGHDCETDVDECLPDEPGHDCDPHATCNNEMGFFTCSCNEHWKSTDLAEVDRLGRMWGNEKAEPGCYDWPDCDSQPCQHGGTCTEGPDGCEVLDENQEVMMVDCYTCTCAYGWTGFDCELDENECDGSENGEYVVLPDICHEESFCTNTPGSYECACNAGWTGDGITCIDADDCEFSPCAHGGTCYDCGTLCFTCDCVQGWRGTTCATDWNECIMGIHQCNDDATCVNNPGSYDCRCDPGFTGDGFGLGFTEEFHEYTIGTHTVTELTYRGCFDIDDCDPKFYQGPEMSPNGPCVKGTCEDKGPNAYYCTCEPGYTDANCDMNINECDPVLGENECHRFANCKDTTGSYVCTCNEGFSGNGYSSCLDISDCYNQCQHGFCTDLGVDNFRCNCDEGWINLDCGYDINECTTYTHECARHALCTNNPGSYTCGCNRGHTGDGWAQGAGCKDVDDCSSAPCSYGECKDEGVAAYTCACQEGFTDWDCDFDINECMIQSHDCHVDARCVNVPGEFFCRCLSGWEGDGLTCTDLDDCDPDPCNPQHGTCEDRGANAYECLCEPGFTGIDCGDDQNECLVGTHGCSPYGLCENTIGSHVCTCPVEFFGDGISCTPCMICKPGYERAGICEEIDYTCVNIDECARETHNCSEKATCTDNEGSFKCECEQNGPGDEFWGLAVGDAGCLPCTVCYDGYHEVLPCTDTTDRVCDINVATGLYTVETEADDNLMCLAMMKGEWYPSRLNDGNGPQLCGFPGANDDEKLTNLKMDGQTIWKFNHIGNENDQEIKRDGDMYSIEFLMQDNYRCLFFGDQGKDLYPSLQSCESYALEEKNECPWENYGEPACGFSNGDMDPLEALFDNQQAIWRITPLKLSEKKYLLQSASKGKTTEGEDGTVKVWECLAFEEQGAATNPSRYNWGNGDTWCGAADWNGLGKEFSLMNNKQAVFILRFRQAVE